MSLLLTEKYAPQKVEDLIGNEEAKLEVKKWALEFERGKTQKPLLIHGPPGIGKTACAKAIASEFNWILVETNASDIRDPENLKRIVGAGGRGLFGQRLLLLDEIDGAFDRGEVPEIVKIAKDNLQPIILTANDVWDKHLLNIRSCCKAIGFKKVNAKSIVELLNRIAKAENMSVEKTTLEAIAKNCNGDVRSAIIDLQGGGQNFDVANYRDRGTNVFEAVRTVFKTSEYQKSVNASEHLDIDLDTFTKWIEENVPIEYEGKEEKAEAFNWLAKADAMNARIRKRQYWGLLRYIRAYSHAGVSLSKKEMYRKFTPYQFPSVLKTLSATRGNRACLESLSGKLGRQMHCSSAKVKQQLYLLCTLPIEAMWSGASEEEARVIQTLRSGNEFKPNEKYKGKDKKQGN